MSLLNVDRQLTRGKGGVGGGSGGEAEGKGGVGGESGGEGEVSTFGKLWKLAMSQWTWKLVINQILSYLTKSLIYRAGEENNILYYKSLEQMKNKISQSSFQLSVVKPKLKGYTESPINQSKLRENTYTCSWRKALEIECERVTVRFCFTSEWMRKWCELFLRLL